jgi:hypothetical protein
MGVYYIQQKQQKQEVLREKPDKRPMKKGREIPAL